jgi:ribose transport system substrate-binding protein
MRTLSQCRRIVLATSVCVVAATGVAATAIADRSSIAARRTIAFVPGQTTDPFYITMRHGAVAEARRLGVKLLWQGAANWDVAAQTAVLNAVLIKKPSALALVPTDAAGMIPPVRKYVNAHIPVIAVDTTINSTKLLVSQITDNSKAGGALAADALANRLHRKGEVAVIRTNPGVTVSDARHDGFVARLKAKYPNIKIVADEYSHNDLTTAQSVTQSILLAHSGVTGIFGVNGNTVIGVAKGVTAAGKKGKVAVAGYDASPAEITLLRKGEIRFLVIQQPRLQGKLAVDYALAKLDGKKVKAFTLTPDVVATTGNVKDRSIAKYFYVSK